ncbi:hypothetical protein [Algoriphagus sp. A40]|uniref:hypothetical protein n=1 Tax=Algoriphagus sp. A40 TaxID=1945863 RepID=UPI00098693C6|nr:hypothetical protein [Algoriphagus sp. A40]OOG75309.1 hypothetical protein B0E43_10020 [Algoriphagus sp. A40]
MGKNKEAKVQKKRERKELIIRRKKRLGKKIYRGSKLSALYRFYRDYESKVLLNSRSKLIDFLEKNCGEIKFKSFTHKIPKVFSLKKNYEPTLKIIFEINKSIFESRGVGILISLDFEDCEQVDLPSLFLLQVCKIELQQDLKRISEKLRAVKLVPKIEVKKSKENSVNKQLWLNGFISRDQVKIENDQLNPIDTIGFLHGRKRQSKYSENRKGKITTYTVRYIDKCLNDFGYELDPTGKGFVEGIISELLNNAEDHSPFDSWYITCNYFKKEMGSIEGLIGELNIAIFNFGYSICEGLEDNRDKNNSQFNELDEVYKAYLSKVGPISKENYFTLLSLQEGVSRLKYLDESRGTGTIKFINSFLHLGDFENDQFKPHFHIFSGFTNLICDSKYKPFEKEGRQFLAFNDKKNLLGKQDANYLKDLALKFPGTLFNAKIYFNEEYLDKKVNGKDS